MSDIVSPERRSALMARIRGKDTGIEMIVRKEIHRLGFRYRLGGAGLPGRPDIVFPKHRTVVFVNGCFWHGHDCPLFRLPKTRREFWTTKIKSNIERDRRNVARLNEMSWRSLTIWECELRLLPQSDRVRRVRDLAAQINAHPHTTINTPPGSP